ncbi:NUDIX domain-containing protein [Pseudomonas tructae]|uniref:NUDIX domain-containing protein n=1 Tax=Pseudomonas tructae TaxID=2518644 RepID=A0A411MNT8_9PSED|nr:NUDIX domain-containing protein [Pseudomonas tructae]QBF28489.1 NUDIX domain-containing protein [Pseudomonas tructae]
MRERKSARLLVISPSNQVLLFRFEHADGALAGESCWATPGGALESDETFEAAAIRELREETGIVVSTVAAPVDCREFPMLLPSGEEVFAVEQYFVVQVEQRELSRAEWTAHELQVMTDHHWWSEQELRSTQETVWPEGLIAMLADAGVFQRAI